MFYIPLVIDNTVRTAYWWLIVRLDSKFSKQTNTCEFRKAVNLGYSQGGAIRDKYTSAAYFSKKWGGLIIEGGVISSEYGTQSPHLEKLLVYH